MEKWSAMVRTLLIISGILLLVYLTTFGWRITPPHEFSPSVETRAHAERIKEIVEHLSDHIGRRNYAYYEQLNEAAAYIRQRFSSMGYTTEEMVYYIEEKPYKNIVAYQGRRAGRDTIVIGAHYDSCFNPGADDNASGVAGLIELARMFKDTPARSHIKFVAFVNEEPPYYGTKHMGSRVYAQRAKAGGERLKAALVLDLIGYYRDERFSQKYFPFMGPFYSDRADFIAVIGNLASRFTVGRLARAFREHSSFPLQALVAPGFLPSINFSDHWSFWEEGFEAVLITDTAYMRSPHYHQETDLPHTLDYDRLTLMLFGLHKAIFDFAGGEEAGDVY